MTQTQNPQDGSKPGTEGAGEVQLPSGFDLRARRVAAGLTQRAVAKSIGAPQAQISYAETGKGSVPKKVVMAYAALLDQAAK